MSIAQRSCWNMQIQMQGRAVLEKELIGLVRGKKLIRNAAQS
jgi:hypothetical protein